jgi:enoyl-[acyl-carrier protein] reductase/trans-2-enoyl-CoA reductase (NAD+)
MTRGRLGTDSVGSPLNASSRTGQVCLSGAGNESSPLAGTEITWLTYWHGTLGQAKQHLDNTARELRTRHAAEGLEAYVGVMKSVVTQASTAIPVIRGCTCRSPSRS